MTELTRSVVSHHVTPRDWANGALIILHFQELEALEYTRTGDNSKAWQKANTISNTELQECHAHLSKSPRKQQRLGGRALECWIKRDISSASSAEFGVRFPQDAWWMMGATQVQPTFTRIFSNLKVLGQPWGSLRRTRISCWMATEFMELSSCPWALMQPEYLHWTSAISEGNRSGSRVMLKGKKGTGREKQDVETR